MNQKKKDIKGFLKSFGYAWTGLGNILFKERNFTIQFLMGMAVILAGIFFHISKIEWFMVIISITVVLSLEIINSALETLADAITERENQKIKIAKDLSAGAVLLTAVGAAVVGLMIFLPRIAELF